MQNRKHILISLTAILTSIMLSAAACSSASKPDSAEAVTEAPAQETAAAEKTASETMQDGTYVPAVFTVQGGTGKVTITCPEVTLTGDEAQALIEVSSPHYEWVKVNGVQYDAENAGDKSRKNSVFRIPVVLDQEMTITGLTTAMSQPHEIEYTLFISLTREDEAGSAGEGSGGSAASDEEEEAAGSISLEKEGPSQAPRIEGLTLVSAMDTVYAEGFDIYTYEPTGSSTKGTAGSSTKEMADSGAKGQLRLIDVHGSAQYLLLPQNSDPAVLQSLPDTITVLQAPLDNLYVAATSSMALFNAAGAIDRVTLTGTKADGWYIEAPKKALADGSMVYAGKYSAPDYELLTSSGCDLAVESLMILHSPEVKEKLEELGIPVFIDTSSRESHPMGRTEWVRLYGVLTGQEAEAEAFWNEQKEQFAKAESYEDTGLTVAYFSISSSGNVVVRASEDYIPQMIRLAGGEYIFKDLVAESGYNSSVRLSMEEFYNTAQDADFLIYNATIESPVQNIDELCAMSSLLSDFKAVQEGNVWQVEKSLYQSPDIAALMITDLRKMLTGDSTEEMTFLQQLK